MLKLSKSMAEGIHAEYTGSYLTSDSYIFHTQLSYTTVEQMRQWEKEVKLRAHELTCLVEDIELRVLRLLLSVTTMADGKRDGWEYCGGSCLCGYTVKITQQADRRSHVCQKCLHVLRIQMSCMFLWVACIMFIHMGTYITFRHLPDTFNSSNSWKVIKKIIRTETTQWTN